MHAAADHIPDGRLDAHALCYKTHLTAIAMKPAIHHANIIMVLLCSALGADVSQSYTLYAFAKGSGGICASTVLADQLAGREHRPLQGQQRGIDLRADFLYGGWD